MSYIDDKLSDVAIIFGGLTKDDDAFMYYDVDAFGEKCNILLATTLGWQHIFAGIRKLQQLNFISSVSQLKP